MEHDIEHLPLLVNVPENQKSRLSEKMGYQLNGHETILAAWPQGAGHHCEKCCPDHYAAHFLMDSGDLWWVSTDGKIFYLPFGDDESVLKFKADNYIPWRPSSTFPSNSVRSKESFQKPFWKDYIGFQVDHAECVIFWKGRLVYHGAYDGRAYPVAYNYHERYCSTNWQEYQHNQFELDKSGKIVWEQSEDGQWNPKRNSRPDTYYYTLKHCRHCPDEVDTVRCGYEDGGPPIDPCAAPLLEQCGFSITGCADGDTAQFSIEKTGFPCTLAEPGEENKESRMGILYKDYNLNKHDTDTGQETESGQDECPPDNALIVEGGNIQCCGDWWTVNLSSNSGRKIIGFRNTLLIDYQNGIADSAMEEQMVCCGDWLFVRYNLSSNQQRNVFYRIDRDEDENIVDVIESWSTVTNYEDSWTACCTSPYSSKHTHNYVVLQNLHSEKYRKIFYNGSPIAGYDWRPFDCNGGLGGRCGNHHNRYHAEECPSAEACGQSNTRRYDIYDAGDKIMSCVEACAESPLPDFINLPGVKVTYSVKTEKTPGCPAKAGVFFQYEFFGMIVETGHVYVRRLGTGFKSFDANADIEEAVAEWIDPETYGLSDWSDSCGRIPATDVGYGRTHWTETSHWYMIEAPNLLNEKDYDYLCSYQTLDGSTNAAVWQHVYERHNEIETQFLFYSPNRHCNWNSLYEREIPLNDRLIVFDSVKLKGRELFYTPSQVASGNTQDRHCGIFGQNIFFTAETASSPDSGIAGDHGGSVPYLPSGQAAGRERKNAAHYRLLLSTSNHKLTDNRGTCVNETPSDPCERPDNNLITTSLSVVEDHIHCKHSAPAEFNGQGMLHHTCCEYVFISNPNTGGYTSRSCQWLNCIATDETCIDGNTTTELTCYGWIVDWDSFENDDIRTIAVDWGIVDSFTIPGDNELCDNSSTFSCLSERIHVLGRIDDQNGIRITVLEYKTRETHSIRIIYDEGASYHAACCGGYWELVETKNDITSVRLYYIGNKISEWINTESARFSLSCCGEAGRVDVVENNKTSVAEVFVCGQDITNTIENLQNNLQLNCCSDYVIISTGNWSLSWDISATEAFLTDGTRCVPDTLDEDGRVTIWRTDDDRAWRLPNPIDRHGDRNLLQYATTHLPFRCKVENDRWAALYHCGTQVIADPRLEAIRCVSIGESELALCPIMDDIDRQRWHINKRYNDSDEWGCSYDGELWFGKWIHNPQRAWHRDVPNLTKDDETKLAAWMDAYPLLGIYIAQDGSLISSNPGSATDIQETPRPANMPTGRYWYVNDRNAAVRYDKQVEGVDQAWPHNCNNLAITLSGISLDDFHSAPSYVSTGDGGRLVVSGNGVLLVYDSEHGRMDFSAAAGELL